MKTSDNITGDGTATMKLGLKQKMLYGKMTMLSGRSNLWGSVTGTSGLSKPLPDERDSKYRTTSLYLPYICVEIKGINR